MAALALGVTGASASPLLGSGAQKKSDKTTQKQALTPEQQEAAAEASDYGTLVNELDPDRKLQLVEDFVKKHPNSAQLTNVYAIAAETERQKNNIPAAVDYAEKSVKLKPDNFVALMFLTTMLPQPQVLKNPADKDRLLKEAETDANQVLQVLSTAPNAQFPKQPNDTDDAFAKRKAMFTSDVHSALGMVHLQRALEGLQGPDKDELAKAEQEYQAAVSGTDQPDPQAYYRLGEALSMDGKIDEAIAAFTKCSELSQGTAMQPYADQKVQELKAKKAKAQAPAKQ
jgi:tetratricopeptide (TPR) repeat protein